MLAMDDNQLTSSRAGHTCIDYPTMNVMAHSGYVQTFKAVAEPEAPNLLQAIQWRESSELSRREEDSDSNEAKRKKTFGALGVAYG